MYGGSAGRTNEGVAIIQWRVPRFLAVGAVYDRARFLNLRIVRGHRPRLQLFRGANSGGTAVYFDGAGGLQGLAVKTKHLYLLLHHALHQYRVAVRGPRRPLTPVPDPGFRNYR